MLTENVENEKSQSREPLVTREYFMPEVRLNRNSPVSLRRQICEQILEAIHSGEIPPATRLPSTRVLARLLNVSRNTMLAAYDELVADGVLRGERGAGMVVCGRCSSRQPSWFGFERVIREANYPARLVPLCDQDGNPLYLRF
jgi:DNA-binding GntR family transcriptional regulator